MKKSYHPSVIPIIFGFSFVFGIVLSKIASVYYTNIIIIIIAMACLALSFCFCTPFRIIFAIFAGLLCGCFRQALINKDQKSLAGYYGRDVIISGTLIDDGENKESQTELHIGSLHINNSINALDCQVYVTLKEKQNTYRRSDIITIRGLLKEGFGKYDGYIRSPTLISLGKPSPPDIASDMRRSFANNIRSLFDADSANLALGYLVGDKTGMTPDFIEKLRVVGLSHLVVTSGFHLSILVEIAKKVFGKISRALTIIGTIVMVIAFVSVTGFSASMARASLISVLSLIAWYSGRKYHPGRLLLYVAVITLCVSPNNLTNVAWQLSFASYFGIIFFAPIITKYLYGSQAPSYIMGGIIVSLAAQLFCLPIGIFNCGMLSIIGIVVGLIISPSIAIIMALTIASGSILPFLSTITQIILKFHLFLITFASNIPWASISITPGDARIFLVYIPLLVIMILLKKRIKYSYRPLYALDKS